MMLFCDRCNHSYGIDGGVGFVGLYVDSAPPTPLCPPCLEAEHLAVPMITYDEFFTAALGAMHRLSLRERAARLVREEGLF